MESYMEFYKSSTGDSVATLIEVSEHRTSQEYTEALNEEVKLEEVKSILEEIQAVVPAVEKEIKPVLETREILHDTTVPTEVKGYKIFRDKPEVFKCDIEISGANLNNSKSRIIVEGKDLTYMFEGTINEKGECKIPLKKMSFLNEYEQGTIKLEIIADDMIFCPWESDFTAINAKKVVVKIIESVDTTPKVGVKVSNIK